MSKTDIIMIRVDPAFKIALSREASIRTNPGQNRVTMTSIILNALYAKEPGIFMAAQKIQEGFSKAENGESEVTLETAEEV